MKKRKNWSKMMLVVTIMPLMVACGSDADEGKDNDKGIPFTSDMIIGVWKIVSTTSSQSDFSNGSLARFMKNMSCTGFHSMETSCKIEDGKMYTYYSLTGEPMYVYTLQSMNIANNDTTMNIRVNGTLDDHSSFNITVEKYGMSKEFPDWQNRNEQGFLLRYQEGKEKIAAGENWMIINQRQHYGGTGGEENPSNCIVMHILEEGTGSTMPYYSDMVSVNYRGRLLPSTNYTQGYVFDQTFKDSYSPSASVAFEGKVNGFIEGFSIALQSMKRGSHCIVYIPSQLAYSNFENGPIPAYSMLVFELWLEDFWTKEKGDRY